MSFINSKVILVTGGASGIGTEIVKASLKNGAKGVAIVDVDANNGERLTQNLAKEFEANRVLFIKTDVTRQEQVEAAFKKTIATFKNLDIVVNGAGILNDKIWEKEIAINLNGTIYSCLLALDKYLPLHKTGDEAVIVNMSSIGGLEPSEALPVYVATKFAVVGLSRSFGTKEHYKRTKVRILTICPGSTNTPLLSEIDGRFLGPQYEELLADILPKFPIQQPEDVAKGILIAIEKGQTGSVWVVNEGKTFEVKLPGIFELLGN